MIVVQGRSCIALVLLLPVMVKGDVEVIDMVSSVRIGLRIGSLGSVEVVECHVVVALLVLVLVVVVALLVLVLVVVVALLVLVLVVVVVVVLVLVLVGSAMCTDSGKACIRQLKWLS